LPRPTLVLSLILAACGGTAGDGIVPPEDVPGEAITVSPSSITVLRPGGAVLTVTVSAAAGFQGTTTLSVTDVPPGVTVGEGSFQGGSGSAALPVHVTLEAAAGRSTLRVRAEAPGAAPRSYPVALDVAPLPVPFAGTIFLDPDIITPDDPTAFQTLTDGGRGMRTMYDRRVANWIQVDAYLFDVRFDDGVETEVQVNPEFRDVESARAQAARFAPIIGRLPTALRRDVQTVWIHKDVQPFGGGNHNLLIHVGQADLYDADGILEETFVHEATHTSLDAVLGGTSPPWVAAQRADGTSISTYARDNPAREDLAETFLLYLALRHRPDRISGELADQIAVTIPHRIAFLDTQTFDLYPMLPH